MTQTGLQTLGGRAQRWTAIGLLTVVTAITGVAIVVTHDISNDAQRATASATIADAYQDARYYAANAIRNFNEFRLTGNEARGTEALAAVTKFKQTFMALSHAPGQAGSINRLQDLTNQLVATSHHADSLAKQGHAKAAAHIREGIDVAADNALTTLSTLEDQAHHRSVAQLSSIRAGTHQLGYATPIVLIAVLLLALMFAVVQRRDRRRVAVLAATDGLTGLPNRLALSGVVAAGLRAERADTDPGAHCALLLLDLDRFKEVNDGLGHQYGDQLLRTVAQRLRRTVSSDDTVARIGGDEFVVFLRSGGTTAAEVTARRIRDALCAPFTIDDVEVDLDVSIGVAAANAETLKDPAALLRAADLAMYAAKTNGGGHVLYSPELGATIEDKVVIVGQVRRAIDADELVLHYQPQISLDDRRMVGVEALLRWEHPTRGLLAPAEFLPAIEDHQIIDQVTIAVLRKALQQSRSWQDLGLRIPISVNVATRALLNLSFPQDVADLLDEYGVEPRLLCVELTETTVMRDSARCARTLWALHELGVRLSVDDYGTGYASMVYLKDLPLDELKIDRSFVTKMMSDHQHRVLTQSVIDLGHNLGLSVVAEGVEDAEVRQALQASGCDVAQGYLYSRPVPPEEIVTRYAATVADTDIPAQRTSSDLTEPA